VKPEIDYEEQWPAHGLKSGPVQGTHAFGEPLIPLPGSDLWIWRAFETVFESPALPYGVHLYIAMTDTGKPRVTQLTLDTSSSADAGSRGLPSIDQDGLRRVSIAKLVAQSIAFVAMRQTVNGDGSITYAPALRADELGMVVTEAWRLATAHSLRRSFSTKNDEHLRAVARLVKEHLAQRDERGQKRAANAHVARTCHVSRSTAVRLIEAAIRAGYLPEFRNLKREVEGNGKPQ
jgi:hypothetical protein